MARGRERDEVLVWFIPDPAMPDSIMDFFLEPTNPLF